MPKSLSSKIYLKERFFGFKMDPTKNLEENLDSFNIVCTELANSGEEVKSVDQTVILLNLLPESYKEIKATIKYGRDSLTVDVVLDALRTKEVELRIDKKDSEALFVKDKQRHNQHQKGKNSFQKGRNSQNRGQSSRQRDSRQHNKSQQNGKPNDNGEIKCNYCHKDGHFKWECLQLKRKANKQTGKDGKNSTNLLDGYESAEVLMTADRDYLEEWIL